MHTYAFIWVFAGITGLVTAGLIGSSWAIFTGEHPRIWMLHKYSMAMPLKVVALCGYAPLAVTKAGLDDAERNPFFGLLLVAIGLLWSFFQGVFILTTFFGFT